MLIRVPLLRRGRRTGAQGTGSTAALVGQQWSLSREALLLRCQRQAAEVLQGTHVTAAGAYAQTPESNKLQPNHHWLAQWL